MHVRQRVTHIKASGHKWLTLVACLCVRALVCMLPLMFYIFSFISWYLKMIHLLSILSLWMLTENDERQLAAINNLWLQRRLVNPQNAVEDLNGTRFNVSLDKKIIWEQSSLSLQNTTVQAMENCNTILFALHRILSISGGTSGTARHSLLA